MRFEETIGISHLIKVIHQGLRQKIDAELRHLKISAAQYAVLAALEEATVLTNADLAKVCSVTPQTMSRIMMGLESEKLVTKQADPSHGLKFKFLLTPKGHETICAAHLLVNEIEKDMLKSFSKKDIKKLMSLLELCL